MSDSPGSTLLEVLEEAKALGFLGPGPVESHLSHADGFRHAWEGPAPTSTVDLGSGGGVPALPLALAWTDTKFLLVEANGRRARFLMRACRTLGIGDRVQVAGERAEILGRDPAQRSYHEAVVARGFAPPAVTAECGAPFLAVGGRLLTSEPPDQRAWPQAQLAQIGLQPAGRKGAVMVLEQVSPCPDRFPRRSPGKRPLF